MRLFPLAFLCALVASSAYAQTIETFKYNLNHYVSDVILLDEHVIIPGTAMGNVRVARYTLDGTYVNHLEMEESSQGLDMHLLSDGHFWCVGSQAWYGGSDGWTYTVRVFRIAPDLSNYEVVDERTYEGHGRVRFNGLFETDDGIIVCGTGWLDSDGDGEEDTTQFLVETYTLEGAHVNSHASDVGDFAWLFYDIVRFENGGMILQAVSTGDFPSGTSNETLLIRLGADYSLEHTEVLSDVPNTSVWNGMVKESENSILIVNRQTQELGPWQAGLVRFDLQSNSLSDVLTLSEVYQNGYPLDLVWTNDGQLALLGADQWATGFNIADAVWVHKFCLDGTTDFLVEVTSESDGNVIPVGVSVSAGPDGSVIGGGWSTLYEGWDDSTYENGWFVHVSDDTPGFAECATVSVPSGMETCQWEVAYNVDRGNWEVTACSDGELNVVDVLGRTLYSQTLRTGDTHALRDLAQGSLVVTWNVPGGTRGGRAIWME